MQIFCRFLPHPVFVFDPQYYSISLAQDHQWACITKLLYVDGIEFEYLFHFSDYSIETTNIVCSVFFEVFENLEIRRRSKKTALKFSFLSEDNDTEIFVQFSVSCSRKFAQESWVAIDRHDFFFLKPLALGILKESFSRIWTSFSNLLFIYL